MNKLELVRGDTNQRDKNWFVGTRTKGIERNCNSGNIVKYINNVVPTELYSWNVFLLP